MQTPVSQQFFHFLLQNQSLLVVKRKLESDVQRISNEHEELISEFRSADERAKKAMTDVSMCTTCCWWEGVRAPQATPPAEDPATLGREGHLSLSRYGVLAPCQRDMVPALRRPESGGILTSYT